LKTRAAIYARTPLDELELQLDPQLDTCRAYSRRKRWSVFREYIDFAEMDETKSRFAWQELLRDAKRRLFDVVLITKLDVAFSSVIDVHETYSILAPLGIKIRVTKFDLDIDEQNPSGLNLLGGLAELHYEALLSHRD